MEQQTNTSDRPGRTERVLDGRYDMSGNAHALLGGAPERTSAVRIKEKRELNRRRRLIRIKHGLMVMLFLIAVGMTSYAVLEFKFFGVLGKQSNANALDVRANRLEKLYNCYATVGSSSLQLSLPGKTSEVFAVGFHEAERKEAVAIKPAVDYLDKESTATVRNAILNTAVPVLFVMNSRGRGSASTSAMDIAMIPNAKVYSPVDGVVTEVKTYNLYNKVTDYHLEIQPDGYPDLRVAIIHIDEVPVGIGQRVKRRDTLIGRMRSLPKVNSQINRYLPEVHDHVHIQINPAAVEGKLDS